MPAKSLLVVEDEALVARDIKARLTRMGYLVLGTAGRGEEAIEKALALRPDLILMDINLKGEIDGVEAAIRIRALYDVPVIFCTAFSNEATLERAKVSEPYGYVLKPFDNRELEINIEIALYKHRVERDLAETRQRLHATLANVSDAVIAADMDGQILLLNPVAEQLTGWCQLDAQSSRVAKVLPLLPFLPGDATLDILKVARLAAPGQCCRVRQYIQENSGARVPIEITVNVMRKAGADLIVITFRDIQAELDTEDEIRRSAFFDGVTGLPNRALFINRLDSTLRRRAHGGQSQFAVAFLDLDGFSAINEGLGHDQGDQVLAEISRRLALTSRPDDTLSRFSGDVFAVLLDPVDSAETAIEACQRLQEAITLPLAYQSTSLHLSASAGIVLHQSGYQTADAIVRDADTALHRAKLDARGSCMLFDQHMHVTALQFIQLKSSLQQALLDGEFEVYYQPVIDTMTERLVSMEALVRWHHPTRGLVSPSEFIPVAEKTGLILPLGELVLRTVCQQIRRWGREGFDGFRVAVNLSARQFESNVSKLVQDIVSDTGISPCALGLEITEGTAMKNVEQSVRMLEELRALGLSISIDDFGTGYSSLACLKRFPLNTLKIDRAFIQDITTNADDLEITRAIISLGHHLNLMVLAEGVETAEQLQLLRDSGCDYIQGYYYSQPLPAENVLPALRRKGLLEAPLARLPVLAWQELGPGRLSQGSRVPPSTSRVAPVI